MLQVIGWRSKAQRLVVLMTDAPPHIAGDGRVIIFIIH